MGVCILHCLRFYEHSRYTEGQFHRLGLPSFKLADFCERGEDCLKEEQLRSLDLQFHSTSWNLQCGTAGPSCLTPPDRKCRMPSRANVGGPEASASKQLSTRSQSPSLNSNLWLLESYFKMQFQS
ncbi:hypothetical protein SprV_0301341400 [Sparganum proliferum]